MTGHDTLALIPVHDEAATIAAVVAGVRGHPVDVLVLDDGSSDDSGERARLAGAEVLRLEPNRGKGLALQEGLRVARQRGYRFAITLDGDLEHDPAELPRFLEGLATGHDLVVGQRTVFRSTARARLNRFATYWYRQIDPRITDTICGFRGFRLEAFADLDLPHAGFEFEQIVLLEAFRRGLSVVFVPVHITSSAASGVTALDLLRANNAFDRWVLQAWRHLPLPRARAAWLAAAAALGLAVGGPIEAVARARRQRAGARGVKR